MKDYRHYFSGYPAPLVEQIHTLIEGNRLGAYLLGKYPDAHDYSNDKALYDFVGALKKRYLKNAAPLSNVNFKKQKDLIQNALGTHTYRMQGKVRKHDVAIAEQLRIAPEALLRALVVHELAHFKEKEHNKAFYALCRHMEPDYHQLELDLRLFVIACELGVSPYRQ